MTDMTLEQVRDSLHKLSKGRMDYVELRAMADAIDAHLAKAADYERAVTEQAMLTECVSVTGRDLSDVIRDVIQWHVSNAAQPVEAVDVRQLAVARYTAGEEQRAFVAGYEAALVHPRHTGDVAALLADAKTKLARAVGTAEAGPSKLWKHDVNSAAWDIERAMDVLVAPKGEQAGKDV